MVLLVEIPLVALCVQKKIKDKEYIIKVEEALLSNGIWVEKTYANTDARVAEALRLLLVTNELRRHGDTELVKVPEYTGENSLIHNCIRFANRSTWREEDQVKLYDILDALEKQKTVNELLIGLICVLTACILSIICLSGIATIVMRLRK